MNVSDKMSGFVGVKPTPILDETSAFYWEAADEERLVLQRCGECERFLYPPTDVCLRCGSTTLIPTEVSGLGKVFSFCIPERAFDPAFDVDLPYVVAQVQLDDHREVIMTTNIVESLVSAVGIGMPVEMTFEDRGAHLLPQFRPVERAL